MKAARMTVLLAIALIVALAGASSRRALPSPGGSSETARNTGAVPALLAPVVISPGQAAAAETAGGMGLLAFKDPKTGLLRAGEAADVRALLRKKARATPDRQLRTAHARLRAASAEAGHADQAYLQGPDGAVGILLDESHLSTLVATLGPDGRLSLSHEADLAAAEARVRWGRKSARTQEER